MPTRTTTLRAAWRPCSVAAESRLANARPGAAPDVLRVSLPKARRFPVLELGAIYPSPKSAELSLRRTCGQGRTCAGAPTRLRRPRTEPSLRDRYAALDRRHSSRARPRIG